MSKLITKLTASVVALALALPLAAQEELTADSVVASVNGTDITLGHMLLVRATLPEQYRDVPRDVLWDGILDQIVQQTVLSQLQEGEDNRRVLTTEFERHITNANGRVFHYRGTRYRLAGKSNGINSWVLR